MTRPGDGAPDVVLVEVGGTVGDIEGQPFLEAIRQMRTAVGRDNTFYVHVTLLPYIGATGELKTKPTQHSVRELRAIGIQPDAIVCRSDHPIPSSIKEKIALFCDVAPDAVIPMQTLSNIYEAPLVLEREGVGDILVRELGLSTPNGPGLSRWQAMTYRMANPHDRLSIAVVGKYADLPDAYLSVREALRHASLHFDRDVSIDWVRSEDIERDGPDAWLGHTLGIVVPGGFGSRGIEGMIQTVRYARERQLPYLGLCLGMQVMVIEHARNVLGLAGANSTEFDPETAHPVIDLMLDQRTRERHGRDDAPRQLSVRARARDQGRQSLRRPRGERAPPPPLRVQQRVPGAAVRDGTARVRPLSGRDAGGDRGGGAAPVHGGGAVPPGVPLAPGAATPAVPRVRRGGDAGAARRRAA